MKNALRSQLQHHRNQLTEAQIQSASNAITSALLKNPYCTNAKKLGLYQACYNEVNLDAVFAIALARQQSCYFPICDDQSLIFANANSETRWRPNRYNIPEPIAHGISASELDCLILPCVGCDHHGFRLGSGAGYYDRCLQDKSNRPWLIAVLYDFQYCTSISPEPWDIRVNEIYTPTQHKLVNL